MVRGPFRHRHPFPRDGPRGLTLVTSSSGRHLTYLLTYLFLIYGVGQTGEEQRYRRPWKVTDLGWVYICRPSGSLTWNISSRRTLSLFLPLPVSHLDHPRVSCLLFGTYRGDELWEDYHGVTRLQITDDRIEFIFSYTILISFFLNIKRMKRIDVILRLPITLRRFGKSSQSLQSCNKFTYNNITINFSKIYQRRQNKDIDEREL